MSQNADQRPGNILQPINTPTLDRTAHETNNPVLSLTDTPPAPSFAPPVVPGEVGRLGSYRIVRQLGRGGMGAVYLAFDTRLDRRLALKIMLPQYAADADAKERFLREARAAAKVAHDNVITIYEADEREKVPYIAMQFLQGYPLDDYLEKKGNLTIPQILRITRETAAGLAAAHRMGLVHRDIKPANLWLEAPSGRVKVLDFGLAKPVNTDIELTKSGLIVGTPAYMSPEQGRGLKVDHRTDLFSLGAVLYRLCTGQLPFLGPNAMSVLMALGTEDPPPVRELNPEVPEPLVALINQLLEKNPKNRPQTAEEVATRLRAIAAGILSPATQAAEKQSQYQVVYVPVEMTVPPQNNPFSELDEAEAVTGSVQDREVPKPARQKMSGRGTWIAAGLASLLAIAALGTVIIIIKNKDGTETKIEVPDDATVTIKGKDGKTLAQVKPNGTQKPDGGAGEPKTVADADSKAVDYVLLMGGYVHVNGDDHAIRDRAELPKERYTLTGVNLYNNKAVGDDGLKVFKDCKSLRYIHLAATSVTDAGLANFKDCKDLTFLELGSTEVTDAGVANFRDCKNLTQLFLHSTKVTDVGLIHFKDCKKLTSLFLYHTAITDVGLDCFDGCTKLRELDLDGTKVTNAGLVNFKDCKEIVSLDLSSTKIGDKGLANFTGCEKISSLNLSRTDLTDAGLAIFQDCKNLRGFRLGDTKVTDAGLANLKGCKMLTEIYLDGTGVTGSGVAAFNELSGLKIISLRNTQVTDAVLSNLKNCKNLAVVYLQKTKVSASFIEALHKALPRCKIENDNGSVEPVADHDRSAAEYVLSIGGSVKVNNENREIGAAAELPQDRFTLMAVNLGRNKLATDAGMANLKDCKSLTELHLNNTNVSDVGLANLKGNENLAHLVLSEIQLTDVGLENFKGCKKLIYLDLTGTKVTDLGLSYVKDCDNLTFLSLVNAPITDAGLANFKGCKNLTRLDLTSTPVTDAGLANFKDCKKLMFLHLPHTHLTDAGLENFKDCKNLGWLTLRGTRVTDEGLAHFKECKRITNLLLDNTSTSDVGLAYFKDCAKLVALDVKKTKVSREFIVEFGQAHPQCRILHDGGTIERK